MNGYDLSRLYLMGWPSDKIMAHFSVTQTAITEKIRCNWVLPNEKIARSGNKRRVARHKPMRKPKPTASVS